jgi:hypothetical protein
VLISLRHTQIKLQTKNTQTYWLRGVSLRWIDWTEIWSVYFFALLVVRWVNGLSRLYINCKTRWMFDCRLISMPFSGKVWFVWIDWKYTLMSADIIDWSKIYWCLRRFEIGKVDFQGIRMHMRCWYQ